MKSALLAILILLVSINLDAQQKGKPALLPADKKSDSLLLEAVNLVNKAESCKRNRKWEEILQFSLPAAEMLKYTNDSQIKGRCATVTGYSYFFRYNYPEAIQYFIEAVEYWKEARNDSAAIYTNLLLAGCLSETGNYTLLLEKVFEALAINARLGNKSLEALCYQSAGNGYYLLKKYYEAKQFLEKAIRINQASGDQLKLVQNLSTFAEILIDEKKFSEAEKYISNAFTIYEKLGSNPVGIQWCNGLLGTVNESRGDSCVFKNNKQQALLYYKNAFKYYVTALKICEEGDLSVIIAEKCVLLGSVCRKLHNYDLSRSYLLRAILIAKEYGAKDLSASAYLGLSRLDSTEGNFRDAFENNKLYKLYSDSLAMEIEKGKTEAFTIQTEINKKEEEIKLLASENKLKTAESEKQNQQKQFAYAAIALLVTGSGYAFYRYRQHKKAELEQSRLKDRLNISQGLHDDIGSTLCSISVYSQVAQKLSNKNEKEDLNEMLEKISITSNEMVSEMNDIVWTVNPRNDSIEKIIQRMESFARPLAAARNIRFDLQYEKSLFYLQLDMDKRKNFYLIFKEAINNAIKYSGASDLCVIIQSNSHFLKLVIKDNGIGFNPAKEMNENIASLSGNGLKNMNARAAELKGSLTIDSHPDSGTIITLEFPFG